jgi:hypothetical protein
LLRQFSLSAREPNPRREHCDDARSVSGIRLFASDGRNSDAIAEPNTVTVANAFVNPSRIANPRFIADANSHADTRSGDHTGAIAGAGSESKRFAIAVCYADDPHAWA